MPLKKNKGNSERKVVGELIPGKKQKENKDADEYLIR